MKRSVWKWLLGISLVLLVLLILFTFAAWFLVNVGGAIFLALLGNTEIHTMPFGTFMANFVGSPLFYVYMADLVLLLSSATALVVTRKPKRQKEDLFYEE